MTNILIDDLNVPGFELLSSEETYLNEINDSEFDLTHVGGILNGVGTWVIAYQASKAAREIHDGNNFIFSPL
jgi:hypothetical protein